MTASHVLSFVRSFVFSFVFFYSGYVPRACVWGAPTVRPNDVALELISKAHSGPSIVGRDGVGNRGTTLR